MNYLRKFGMEYNPFLKSKDIKIELSEYKQLLFRLKHLEEIKGIGIITGEPGLGKTTAIRYWTNTLNKTMFKVIYIPHSTLTVMEFYRLLCDEFSLEVNYSKRKNFKSIQDEIKRLVIEKRITPVIILDEANYLPSSILNDLKILLNFDMDSKDNVILILIGQKTFLSTLSLKSNESLKQRISMNYNISGLSNDEARYYIDQKLQASGLNTNLLSIEAYNQVINAANGVPRIINQIMDKALLLICNYKLEEITETIAMEAINEVAL